MTIKANGHSALILATGLFVCFAAPSLAAEGSDAVAAGAQSETAGAPLGLHAPAKQGSRHPRKHARRKSSKVARTASDDEKSDKVSGDDGAAAAAIPVSVANANAQLASAETPAGNAKAMSARANDVLQTAPASPWEPQPAPQADVISANQLNDVDRALHESAPPAPTAMAAADEPTPAPAKSAAATTSESSAWDQTSLIGKIFIGFGALLTVASAARMFMA
jgi:hypothetical protein